MIKLYYKPTYLCVYPDIKFIIPHAGAFLTILADRIAFANQLKLISLKDDIKIDKDKTDISDIFSTLRGLYYDLAGACLPRQLPALLQIVNADHLLYGSDYPYTPKAACTTLAATLGKTDLLTDEQRYNIYYGNALKLFPRLK